MPLLRKQKTFDVSHTEGPYSDSTDMQSTTSAVLRLQAKWDSALGNLHSSTDLAQNRPLALEQPPNHSVSALVSKFENATNAANLTEQRRRRLGRRGHSFDVAVPDNKV
uniref:KRUF family protein n=1 Tax=Mesocestoides corti TaxID=53468 RepID=A0A5K3FPW6_MESCO